MPLLKKILKERLKSAKRIALLGIGSDLRGDDAAGVLVAKAVKSPKIKVFIGSTAPENLTGEIKRFKPTHVIIVDTAEIGEKPGTILLLKPDEIEGVTFSTHAMPTKILADYLKKSLKCKIVIIGIQPKSLKFGERPSPEVKKTAKLVAATINKAVKSIGRH